MLPALLLLLLAEADVFSGNAGWAGAGLLGLVLCWLLLKHLPDKDKQLKELLTSRDELLKEQLKVERDTCERRHQENLASLRDERAKADRRHEEAMAEHHRSHDEAKEMRHMVANVAQSLGVWTALVKQALGLRVPNLPPADKETA